MRFYGYKFWHLCSFLMLALMVVACEEKGAEEEYSDWEVKNNAFIDSIAQVAHTNADGSWAIYKAYTLGDSTALYNGQNNRFIYVKKLEQGTGTVSPLYTESVRVHYSGHLIPSRTFTNGFNFDKSYAGDELNPLTDVPALFTVSSVVTGFSTALQYMKVGDRWMVYIPYMLGYGTTVTEKIPAYSTLIFDIKLAKIYANGETNTDWY